jgi:hypothetical protein
MAAGGVLALVGSFLPWVRTGSRSRNSFDVLRVLGRLGIADDGSAATAIRWWPLVPLLAVGAIVAVWWGWGRAGGVVGVVAAVYAGAMSIVVPAAPGAELVEVGAGPAVTGVGAVVLLVGAVLAVVVDRGEPPGAVTPATGRGGSARP